MKTAFIKTLSKLTRKNKDIFLITGDLGYSFLEGFAQEFPRQYLNIGVAEQNMIGVASGLALSGRTVFVYSIVPFVTLRCLEQVRNDICLQGVNVKLIGVGEGFSYGQLGPTHHSIEDIAITRTLPNMTVVCPGDPWEVERATEAIAKIPTPCYLRLGKKGEPILHGKNSKFTLGRGILMNEGRDLTIISTGNMLEAAVAIVEKLKKSELAVRLISMHTVKPLDEKLVVDSIHATRAIFTLEENSVIGGLGSAVAQIIAEWGLAVKFHSFGVNDRFTKMAGSSDYLRTVNDLSVEKIVKRIKDRISS